MGTDCPIKVDSGWWVGVMGCSHSVRLSDIMSGTGYNDLEV